jgi:hypothetical protein
MAKAFRRLNTILCVIALVCVVAPDAVSQSSQQLAPVQRLYVALTRQFASSPDTFLIILNPGIAIDPWTDPRSAQFQAYLSHLVDEGVKPQPIVSVNPARVSSIYEQVLREGIWGHLILDKTQEQQVTDANRLLYKDIAQKIPTVGYAQYLSLRNRYAAAQAVWDSTPEDKRTEEMRADLDKAARDLELRGNAPAYQGALEILATISDIQPGKVRDRWIEQLEGSTSVAANGVRSFPTEVVPVLTFDYSNRWIDIATDSAVPSQEIAGLAWPSDFVGPWRFCKSSTFADGDDREPTSAIAANVSLEVKSFAVVRPWLDEDLFAYGGWNSKDAPAAISSGNSPLKGNATGYLPLMITHIILGRKVVVDGTFSQEENLKLSEQRKAGKCSAFGPFIVSGQAEFGNDVLSFPYATGFYLPGVQLIAVIAKPVPKSPSPDSNHFTWP